jgi:hypothetical protein
MAAFRYSNTGTGRSMTIRKPETAIMNVMHPDSVGTIKIFIDPKRLQKEVIWTSDSTFIIKAKK